MWMNGPNTDITEIRSKKGSFRCQSDPRYEKGKSSVLPFEKKKKRKRKEREKEKRQPCDSPTWLSSTYPRTTSRR